MIAPIILGLIVSLASFAWMYYIVLEHCPKYTLPALLAAIFVGLMLPLLLDEFARTIYHLSWMLGWGIGVLKLLARNEKI